MGKKATPLQKKKQSEEVRERKIAQALKDARRAERKAYLGPKKRKEIEVLRRFLALPTRSYHAIRDVDEFQTKVYAMGKQVLALVDHLFVRYPVPAFLYRTMLTVKGEELVFGDRDWSARAEQGQRWFLTVAQGRSFSQATKGFFTKREAHEFLQAPGDFTIGRAILWARCAAAGLGPRGVHFLLDRFGEGRIEGYGARGEDLIRFYATFFEQMRGDRIEVADFLREALESGTFSLKGRTLGSVRKLTRQWHRTRYWGTYQIFRSWSPRFPDWKVDVGPATVVALELCDSDQLAAEGLRQRHCVVTYSRDCAEGRCRIVSLRWLGHGGAEFRRLTLEIWPDQKKIVQIKGNHNRNADEAEMKVVRKWASQNGLELDDC
ncbi:MAG TPA: PcfJ domain-containing protein [Fimbriimonadaceae bacterium]|nr:PcfJ domain-containing protein [Fimbriimonadaceae bacterium]HRJ95192.1 PcfJ domain-containing protein [Fimbriimonadaceae bacterium]